MDACTCVEHGETFFTLAANLAHWEFELFLMLIFDVVLGMVAWPFVKRHWAHHVKHDDIHKEDAKDAVVSGVLQNGRTGIQGSQARDASLPLQAL